VDEIALFRDTISHYAPVLIARLSIPNSSRRRPEKIRRATTERWFLRILAAKGTDILLCAPTGRAAKRMTEATGFALRSRALSRRDT
jgi:hypothetical protein